MNECPIPDCTCFDNPDWQRPCVCGRLLLIPDRSDRLCADCRESLLENIANKIDPTYDPTVMHEWAELESILWRVYGKLHLGCCERSVE